MPPELYVILVAALPVVELRGAIPLGVALGLSPGEAFLLALLGNLLVAPVALFLLPWAVALLTRVPFLDKLWAALEARVRLKGEEQVQRLGALGLFLFVAVPLPGTGAWSGAVLAVVLGLKGRYALLAISLGVLAAGLIVLLLTGGAVVGLNYLR
ncbi:small multidrug export protein [Thermus scotoductus]|uniref:Small multidrug export protein n=1 Tax=Thermus scotoductus TaxID=37636 RepID=A0ABY0AIZ9_THESC|nr:MULTISPECIES: small multi-drug export protein [Thermus]RTH19704.1 small multidrug export protein [Thermus scotoductus]RTH34358.1 small multidrug export protein [Thermus scotoductus]RTI08160.1 small multidrug export protein [Thermus scotoductus]RTI15833.1 small multidrug export protein [Thermus scotoductus]RTI25360.1 small multidrug export protein [Thermus scotoductus]